MMRIVFVMALCLAFYSISSAQVVKGTAVWYFDSIPNIAANAAYRGTELAYSIGLEKMYRWDRQDSTWVELSVNVYELDAVADTSTITMPQEGDIAITEAILLVRSASAWLQFAGGDDWGDQVVEKDSTLRGDGTAGAPLRVNRDSFLTAAIIEDSLAAVREDILPTDLSFSGASSPVALQSSTGTDVSFLAGNGIGLAQAGNQLTINNTGITGSGTANYIPKFTGTSTIGSTLFQEVSSYILRIGGSYNSNTTGLDIWATGSNPYITQANDNNNYLILRTNGGSLGLTRRSDNSVTMEINRGNNRTNLATSLWVGSSSGTPAARLHTTGSGSTSATFSFLAENSSGTDHFYVRNDGGVFVPVRSGTATSLGGWTSDHMATNTSVSSRLSLSSGTLDINADSIPTFATLPLDTHIGNTNLSISDNRTLQLNEKTLEFFREGNNYTPYDLNSNLYSRIGTDTVWRADQSYAYPIEGHMLSINYDLHKAKLAFGLDPDFYYSPSHVGFFQFDGTEFDPGYRLSYEYSAFDYALKMADPDDLGDNIIFHFSRDYGIVIDRGDSGTQFMSFSGTGFSDMKFTNQGIRFDGPLTGETNIGQYIETIPYETNFPTALAGWSTPPLLGSRYISEIHLGKRLNFSNDTLNVSTVMLSGYATKTVANTATQTTLQPTTAAGSSNSPLKAGQSYRVEASGYYTTDTINTNITVSLTFNGVTVATTGSVALEVTEGGQFHLEGIVTIYSIGNPGTTFSQGRAEFIHTQGDADVYRMLRTATNSVNTSIGAGFELQVAWATASASNSLTCTNYIVKQLNAN